MTGDPTAVYTAGGTWIAYATRAEVVLRRATLNSAGQPTVGPALPIPSSQGAEPTLAAFGNRLVLLLWRSPNRPVGRRVLRISGPTPVVEREKATPLTSLVPVAATAGGTVRRGVTPLWVTTMEGSPDGDTRTFVHRLEEIPGNRGFRQTAREPIPGSFAPHRPTLLWTSEKGWGAEGRLFHFGGGIYEMNNRVSRANTPWAQQIVSMQVANPEVNGGWLHRRYYTQPGQPGDYFMSRSAPGACWFGGGHRLRQPPTRRRPGPRQYGRRRVLR